MNSRSNAMNSLVVRSWRARSGAPTFALVLLATIAASLDAQGSTRSLSCRGKPGMVLRVDQDPSPRDTANVTMVLEYRRPATPPGSDLRKLEPGTCTWSPTGWPNFPVEPGRVRLDVRRQGQRWSATGRRMMDTTVRSAIWFPDPITLPRYLLDTAHYWRFYVNDVTNFSTSYGALFESGTPTYVWITGPVQFANDVRRDLLCRGGTSGLLYGGGATIGSNQARVQLSYRVSPRVPGSTGAGLAPGSCAWTDRTAMPPEPGKIWFVTASNAQLRQMQSGVPVDRSPTAAERYPDVRTIPEYLKNPAHYWRFTVASRAPDSALAHGVWRPNYGSVAAGGLRDPGTSTVRSQPATAGTTRPYTPGAGGATTRVGTLFDIRNVRVTPALEGVVIRFEAAANSNPKVTLTPATVGAPITLAVGSSASSPGMMRYVAASNTKLLRGTSYNYGILAAATGNARTNNASGTFRTLSQRVTIRVSQIDLISDGDADSDGEVIFAFRTCPSVGRFYLSGVNGTSLSWGDGRHGTNMEIKSDTVPDQFRLLVDGTEDDRELLSPTSVQSAPSLTCARPNRAPGSNADGDWNSLTMDFDLTKYPGARGGEQFYRRSQPLRNGSRLSFDIRGSIEVTRQ